MLEVVEEVEVVPIFKDKKEKRWGNYGGKETNRHEAFQPRARSGRAARAVPPLSSPLLALSGGAKQLVELLPPIDRK